MAHDRMEGSELPPVQASRDHAGAQRPQVTVAVQALEREGLIKAVLDRWGLIKFARGRLRRTQLILVIFSR